MDKQLLTYLYNKILPIYRHFDAAHQIDHVEKVIENALEIAASHDVNHDMVYVIACYHDIGMQYGRNDHHLTGGLFLYEDQELKQFFSPEERVIMKEAIEDHRASMKEAPRSIYGKIIAEADRDIDCETVILRTVQFGMKHYPNIDEKQHVERAYQHIEDKYGPNGYLNLWLETRRNREGLNEIHRLLKDPDTMKTAILNQYKKIKNK